MILREFQGNKGNKNESSGQEHLLARVLLFFLVLCIDHNNVDGKSWVELKQKEAKEILGLKNPIAVVDQSEMPAAEKVMEDLGEVKENPYLVTNPSINAKVDNLPKSEKVIDELSADATMDELEADIQRRLNLIKESLAKLDAPLSETSTKKVLTEEVTYPTSGVYSAYNLGVEQHTTVSEDATQKMISKTPPVENKLDEFSKKSTYDAVDPKYEETYKTTSKDTTPTYHDEIVSKLPDSIVTTADSIYTATYQTTPTETSPRYLEEKPNIMEMKTDAIYDETTEPPPSPETLSEYREENSTDAPTVVDMTPVPTTARACCRALTAECLACSRGQSTEQFCADEANKNVVGCEGTPPSKQEGEDCGPCFNPGNNFNCGSCAEGLECKKDPESAMLPDAPEKCRKKSDVTIMTTVPSMVGLSPDTPASSPSDSFKSEGIKSNKPVQTTKDNPYSDVILPPNPYEEKSNPSPLKEEEKTSYSDKPAVLPNGYFGPDNPSDPDPFATFPKEKIDEPTVQNQPNPKEATKPASEVKDVNGNQQGRGPKLSLADFEAEESLFNSPSSRAQPHETRRKFGTYNKFTDKIAYVARRSRYGVDPQGADDTCPSLPLKCDPESKIRTYDGTCNNLQYPEWGAMSKPYKRFFRPMYEDGVHSPRGASYDSTTGYKSRLPSPRKISTHVFQSQGNGTEDKKHTHMLMQFGQMIDHEITSTALSEYSCCDPKLRNNWRCYSIDLSGDEFYGEFAPGRTCMDFTRSHVHCKNETYHKEQINAVTSYIDGSAIYGSYDGKATCLRSKDGNGQLAVAKEGFAFLPHRAESCPAGGNDAKKMEDFIAGDDRAMSQPTLLSMHVIWFREHNRIAKFLKPYLKSKGQQSEGDILFQAARSILIAEFQNVIYKEWLPAIFGPEILDKYNLRLYSGSKYDHTLNAHIRNEFTTAAFRFGHSMVQGTFRGTRQPWRLGNFFGDEKFAVHKNWTGCMREIEGSCNQSSMAVDTSISKELTNNLYNSIKVNGNGTESKGMGFDLGAINIQRGRDHGIASYNEVRKALNLAPITNMNQPPPEISGSNWDYISKAYPGNPDDIDLYSAGLAETPLPGGLLGPAFTFIIAEQFRLLKEGDRFFFTNTQGIKAGGLQENIQKMIMERTLSDIICENTDIKMLQKNVFLTKDQNNPLIPCDDKNARAKLDFKMIAESLADVYNGAYDPNAVLPSVENEVSGRYGVWIDETKQAPLDKKANENPQAVIEKEKGNISARPLSQEPPTPDILGMTPPDMVEETSERPNPIHTEPSPLEPNMQPPEEKLTSSPADIYNVDNAPPPEQPNPENMPQPNLMQPPEPKANSPETELPAKEPPLITVRQTQETPEAHPTPIMSPEANTMSESEPYSQGVPLPENISQPNPAEIKPQTDPYATPPIVNEQSPSNKIIDPNTINLNEVQPTEASSPTMEAGLPTDVTQNVPNMPQEKTGDIDSTGTPNMEIPIPTQPEVPKEAAPIDSPY